MLYRLAPHARNHLPHQPESGMGYQLVDGVDGGSTVVFNAEIVCWFGGDMVTADDCKWLVAFLSQPDEQSNMLDMLDTYKGPIDVVVHGSYPSTTRAGETLVRYSVLSPDRRISGNGSVSTGTDATTAIDAQLVPSGLAAVGRYALPNTAPAIYRYMLTPPLGTNIHCGTSAPLFGQAGGGVEIRLNAPLPPVPPYYRRQPYPRGDTCALAFG